ncbi:MAG TPA: endonuclease/exonuclease/phosphatase family protein [Chitinophagaceae bacterium]|nr:endonuclease/exonuclease/phosphatase family protein [Chitinophagaceae bacterium]
MASKFRVFTRRFLIFLHIVAVLFFLLACLAPHVNPQAWWFISFLGFAFPFLLLIVILFALWWLFFNRKLALISVAALLIGYKSISVFFAFHLPGTFNPQKEKTHIRIATWNVARFVEIRRNLNEGSRTRLRMMEQIAAQNADVLCLQEFYHSVNPDFYDNINYISRNYKYPYYYYALDADGDRQFYGSIIFSRFPIIDSGLIRYPRPSLPEALIHADILAGKDTIRVYTTHLQSLQFKKDDYAAIDKIKGGDEGMVSNSKRIFSKLRTGIANRKLQTDIIEQVLEDCPYPLLFCGDLNDIPNSHTYFSLRGNMQDAFLKKGSGIGRTFSSLSPTLRIDYIFAQDAFRIHQFNRIVKPYSDHYMLVADVEVRKEG